MQKVVAYFGAGPAKLPSSVLENAKETLVGYPYPGISILELSHRDKAFDKIRGEACETLRSLLSIPQNYKILLMQGGGSGQFAAVCLNLVKEPGAKPVYIITGSWSEKAYEEAKKYCEPYVAVNTKPYTSLPNSEQIKWPSEPPPYVYYCSNETIHGVEFQEPLKLPDSWEGKVPLVVDMSSNFLSRSVDVSKYGVIYAGAQKNCGIAGLTFVIVRDDLLDKALPITPSILHYKTVSNGDSVTNTAPVFGIYVSSLVFKWIQSSGGVEAMEKANIAKSESLYTYVDGSTIFYAKVSPGSRSRMNIVFGIKGGTLEDLFLKESLECGLLGLEGHRSVGGLRASLYNAVGLEDVGKLVEFMKGFEKKYGSQI
eukprot:TRINITY_DN380_c0_g1_i3.p1 TRINITY_DN380_c0_g1~~TRINITY_DN380_c0_g1_i3.p1  ORF type:complete len:401 (-),score=69.81 TRINITY_DN380_c0_g1_i3:32-1141(-)